DSVFYLYMYPCAQHSLGAISFIQASQGEVDANTFAEIKKKVEAELKKATDKTDAKIAKITEAFKAEKKSEGKEETLCAAEEKKTEGTEETEENKIEKFPEGSDLEGLMKTMNEIAGA